MFQKEAEVHIFSRHTGKWVTERLRNLSKTTQEIVNDWIRNKTQVLQHFKQAKASTAWEKQFFAWENTAGLKTVTIFSRPVPPNHSTHGHTSVYASRGKGSRGQTDGSVTYSLFVEPRPHLLEYPGSYSYIHLQG